MPMVATAIVTVDRAKNQSPGCEIAFARPLVFAAKTTIATSNTSIIDHFASAAAHPLVFRFLNTAWKLVASFISGKRIENTATTMVRSHSSCAQRLATIDNRDGVSEKNQSFSNLINGNEIPRPNEIADIRSKIGRKLASTSTGLRTFRLAPSMLKAENEANPKNPASGTDRVTKSKDNY